MRLWNLSNAVLFFLYLFFRDDTTNERRGDGVEKWMEGKACMGASNEVTKTVYGWFVDLSFGKVVVVVDMIW
jgi:hypothetical protein